MIYLKYNNSIMAIILMIIIFLFSCHNYSSSESQYDSSDVNVKVSLIRQSVTCQKVAVKKFALTSDANGLIKSFKQSKLNFKVGGTIAFITVSNGSDVKAGQVIAQLDDRDQQLALRVAKDQVAESQVQLRAFIADYGGNDLDTTTLKLNARSYVLVKSGYYKAQTALAHAKLQLEYTILRAPYDGIVANLGAKAYNFITAYEPFCTLISKNRFMAEFSILENELINLKLGQDVKITLVSNSTKTYFGKVVEINPFVSSQGLVLVKAQISNPDNNLFEGMNVHIRIERTISNQLVVPKSSIVERSGQKVIFIVEQGRAKWRYVTIAHENENQYSISKGLEAGDSVIITGNLNLAHDINVNVLKDERKM